jgi:hypothetical protein
MWKSGIVSSAACAVLFSVVGASSASAQILDRVGTTCGRAVVTVKFQQEEAKREVDVEVYSTSRGERWRVELRDTNGKLLHRMNRTTGRDGAFDVWRFVPPKSKRIDVSVTGPSGQDCSIQLAAT